MGLPQGRILAAKVVTAEDGSVMIAATLWDQRNGRKRPPRFFDPAGFLAIRLLLACKTRIRVDRTDHHPRPARDEVVLYDDIIARRVLAGAKPGEVIEQRKDLQGRVIDHHDLRLRNFVRSPASSQTLPGQINGATHQGRADAIRLALENGEGLFLHPTTFAFHKKMLKAAFDLLDDMHGDEVGSA